MNKNIKDLIPKNILWKLKLLQEKKRSNMSYAKVERDINKSYHKLFGANIDWDNPQKYNEKLKVAMLYNNTEIKTRLTDKIDVREWVKENTKKDECNLIPLLGIYNSIDEINFKKLPEQFVIKMNNDSGSVTICDKEHPLSKQKIKEYRKYFEKRNFAYSNFELHYKTIKPKVMIEKYMGDSIRDYKFMCFNGTVAACWVDFDRFTDHRRNFYDREWKLLPIRKKIYANNLEKIPKPKNYEKMWKLAEKMSKGFDQVRVDFYDIDGLVYFGEMTFTNGNGTTVFCPESADDMFGKLWKMDMDTIRKNRNNALKNNTKVKNSEY